MAAFIVAITAVLLWAGIAERALGVFIAGALGLACFGPTLLIMGQGLIRPSYLQADAGGLRCRFYSVELDVRWPDLRAVTGGVGRPALIFRDAEAVAGAARFRGLLPLSWVLELPARVTSALLRRPIATIYPMTPAQLLRMFRANERAFGFHYRLPTDALEQPGRDISAALQRWHARHGGAPGA